MTFHLVPPDGNCPMAMMPILRQFLFSTCNLVVTIEKKKNNGFRSNADINISNKVIYWLSTGVFN